MADPTAEKFAPAGGRVIGWIGIAVVVGLVVIDVAVDPGSIPLPVVTGALVLAVLMWATMIRPRVSTGDGLLVLRNALSTIEVPLAAVEDLSVRQVLAVRTARRRYVASGVGRTVRQAIRSKPVDSPGEAMRPALGPAFGGDAPSQVEPGMAYADWVELRLRDLVQADRDRRRVRAYSEEVEALADEVVRRPAWPEIAALAVSGLAFVVAVLVAALG